MWKRSLEITEKNREADHPDVAARLDGLGQTYIGLGKCDQAEALYKRSLLAKPTVGAITSLSSLYVKEGKYALAEPLLSRAADLTAKLNGPKHYSLPPILDAYADVLEKLKRKSDAVKVRAKAKEARSAG